MLPKSERLTKEDFTGLRPKVFFRGEFFDIAYSNVGSRKFACVTAKKTMKRAVDRNLIKRRVMEIIKDISPKKQFYYIVYPKKSSCTAPYQSLYKEISKAFATLQ